MEEVKNVTVEELNDVIASFPLEPLFNKVYITLNSVEYTDGVLLNENILSEEQYVISHGDMVNKKLKPGIKVLIDIEKLMVNVGQSSTNSYENLKEIRIDLALIDGVKYGLVDDRVIKAIYK